MHYFKFKRHELCCEDLKISDLAAKFGTPLYVYSTKTILDHFLKLKKAFFQLKPLICYSVKANSNLAILKLLISKGAGLDIVSGGELFRAKKVKCPPKRVVYASVGKTENEIKEAIRYGILMFNVESLAELKRINFISGKLNKVVDVCLRFNPDIGVKAHKYITTGKKGTKFGMNLATIRHIFSNKDEYKNLNIIGMHIHIGSQITESAPFVKAVKKITAIIKELKKKGVSLEYLNIGGGLGIVYDKERPQTAKEFADKVVPLLKSMSLKIILEPGRFIIGNAGILVSRVIYTKDSSGKRFIISDAAMNDLARPSLYGAYHKIDVVKKTGKATKGMSLKIVDIVGPICESGDFLGKARKLDVREDELIAVFGSGAYGFSMSSNYNSRPRAAEVLVNNSKVHLIRKRESYKDLVRNEILR